MTKKPLHIAYIGQKGIPARWGGVERATEEVAVRMAAAGYFVTAYCRSWYALKEQPYYRGVRLVYTPTLHTKHLDTITHTFFSTIHAMWSGVDVIHFQGIGPAILAWLPRLFSPRTTVVVTLHCLDRKLTKWGSLARIAFYAGEFFAARFAHRIFATSHALQTYFLQTWNREAEYLPNGVFSDVEPSDLKEQLSQFDLAPYSYVVSVGRLMHDKAQHEVIESFIRAKERLGDEFAHLKLVIIGESAQDGREYEDGLRASATDRTDIIFTGFQSGSTLKALMKFARTGVSLSYSEGMPLAVLELGGAGVPLVLSDISAHQEIFGEQQAYVEVGNVERASKHIERAVRNFDDVRIISQILSKRLQEQYSWEMIVAQYIVSVASMQSPEARESF